MWDIRLSESQRRRFAAIFEPADRQGTCDPATGTSHPDGRLNPTERDSVIYLPELIAREFDVSKYEAVAAIDSGKVSVNGEPLFERHVPRDMLEGQRVTVCGRRSMPVPQIWPGLD